MLLVGGSVLVVILVVLLVPLGPVGWVAMLGAMAAAFVVWFAWLMRWGTRVATVPPCPGARVVPTDDLLERLDALSRTGWAQVEDVAPLGRRLVAFGPVEHTDTISRVGFARESKQEVATLEVHLDAGAHRVIVTEGTQTTTAGVSVSPGSVGAHWGRDWFRGITMPVYEPADPPALSWDPEQGWLVRTRLGASPADLRSAVVDVVCSSGWTYVPTFRAGRWSSAPAPQAAAQ